MNYFLECLTGLMAIKKKESNVVGKSAETKCTTKRAAAPTKKAASATTTKKKTSTNKSTAASKVQKISTEGVAFRAWEIWQSEGCPEGRHVDNWIQAEKELSASK
jgi:hypothetical protein